MIKIAICDDEEIITSQIENIIHKICEQEDIPVDVDVFYYTCIHSPSSSPPIQAATQRWEAQSFNHWLTKEVPL